MDRLACVGRDRSFKASLWTGKPVWEMSMKIRLPCGQVGLWSHKVNVCLYGHVILCGLCRW